MAARMCNPGLAKALTLASSVVGLRIKVDDAVLELRTPLLLPNRVLRIWFFSTLLREPEGQCGSYPHCGGGHFGLS